MVCVGGWFGCVVYTPTRDRRHIRHTLMTAQCERDTRTAMPWLAAFYISIYIYMYKREGERERERDTHKDSDAVAGSIQAVYF